MIIKALEIKNFKSYKGENKFSFKKGLNIISGSIGSGKTSLFESFQWLIEERNDQYIDSLHVPNKAILNESKKSNSSFEVSVCLLFENKGRNCSVSKIFEYKIIDNQAKISNEYFKYQFTHEITGGSIIEEDPFKVKRIISKEIFPQQIREYLLFKGENLDNLIDFQNPKTLKSAVDRISYLKYYESIFKNTSSLLSKLQIKLDRKIKVNDKHKSDLAEINSEIQHIEKFKLPKKRKEIEDKEKELKSLTESKEKLLSTIQNNGDYPDFKAKYERALDNEKRIINEISDFDINFKKTYLSSLMIFGQNDILEKCEKEFKKYSEKKQKEIQEGKAILEIGIPGDEHVHEMLEKCECKICGHKFEKFSKEYKTVQSHLDSKKLDLKKLISDEEREFERSIDEFRNSIPQLKKKVSYSKQYFDSLIERKQDLEKRRAHWNDQKNMYKEKIAELLKKNPNLSDSRDSNLIKSEFTSLDQTCSRLEKLIGNLKIDDINLKNRITKLNADKTKYAENPDELNSSSEKKSIDYVSFLQELSKNQITKEKINFVKSIEERSNKIQEGIIKSGDADNLVVLYSKIDPDDLSVNFYDIKGEPNPGHGAQLKLSKLSIISSVLNLSNEKVDEVFPFIVDAPSSELDHTVYEPYIKSLSSNLVQSIVLLKDINNELDRYKNKDFIDCLYKIEKKSIDNKEAALENSYTVITKLK